MILGYSEVEFGVKTDAGFCGYGAVFESEEKLLLIERGGRFQCSVYALYKPIGRGDVGRADLVRRFAFTRRTLRFAVAYCDDKHEFFALVYRVGAFHLGISERNPAGIKPQRLRDKHEFFAVIARFFA